jgi:hypothetical protein
MSRLLCSYHEMCRRSDDLGGGCRGQAGGADRRSRTATLGRSRGARDDRVGAWGERYTFSEILAAVLTAIYLCSVCSCQEILRRNGRKVSGYTFSEILFRNLMAVEVIESSGYGSSTMAAAQPTRGGSLVLPIAAVVSLLGGAAAVYLSLRSRRFRRWWGLRSLRLSKAELEAL